MTPVPFSSLSLEVGGSLDRMVDILDTLLGEIDRRNKSCHVVAPEKK
jgi:hypothetical protein